MQVYLSDALKEPGVQSHVVGMLCQQGLHLLCQSVHLVVGLSTEQVEEYGAYPRQQVVVALVLLRVDDGIVEGRLLRVVDGLLYLLVVATDTFQEGLFVVFQPDAVERYGVVGCAIRFEKRVLMLIHTNVFLILRCKDTIFRP